MAERKKHSCVYGAYYFSYLFKAELDTAKINFDCIQVVNSVLDMEEAKGYYKGYYCGKGISLAYNENIPEQNKFMKNGFENFLNEDRAKITEFVSLCLRAVEMKFEPVYKAHDEKFDNSSDTVEPPPRSLYLEFTNISCDIASSTPCFD